MLQMFSWWSLSSHRIVLLRRTYPHRPVSYHVLKNENQIVDLEFRLGHHFHGFTPRRMIRKEVLRIVALKIRLALMSLDGLLWHLWKDNTVICETINAIFPNLCLPPFHQLHSQESPSLQLSWIWQIRRVSNFIVHYQFIMHTRASYTLSSGKYKNEQDTR